MRKKIGGERGEEDGIKKRGREMKRGKVRD